MKYWIGVMLIGVGIHLAVDGFWKGTLVACLVLWGLQAMGLGDE